MSRPFSDTSTQPRSVFSDTRRSDTVSSVDDLSDGKDEVSVSSASLRASPRNPMRLDGEHTSPSSSQAHSFPKIHVEQPSSLMRNKNEPSQSHETTSDVTSQHELRAAEGASQPDCLHEIQVEGFQRGDNPVRRDESQISYASTYPSTISGSPDLMGRPTMPSKDFDNRSEVEPPVSEGEDYRLNQELWTRAKESGFGYKRTPAISQLSSYGRLVVDSLLGTFVRTFDQLRNARRFDGLLSPGHVRVRWNCVGGQLESAYIV